jgi:hypothetical protein
MCTLITSKGTDIDENIANPNHAPRTRTPKPGYLNLSINNFLPYNHRYDVFYEKYTLIKTSFHGVVLCVALFPLLSCIVLNSNATFAFPTPHKSQLLSPKIWETRDQPGPGSFLQRGA